MNREEFDQKILVGAFCKNGNQLIEVHLLHPKNDDDWYVDVRAWNIKGQLADGTFATTPTKIGIRFLADGLGPLWQIIGEAIEVLSVKTTSELEGAVLAKELSEFFKKERLDEEPT